MRVAVVGASGRVGTALVDGLSDRFDVVAVSRRPDERPEVLAERATHDVDAVVNAAGVAHVEQPTADDIERLRVANVELPALLAAACASAGCSLVHISSVKAVSADPTPYAQSKRDGDRGLVDEFGDVFEQTRLHLVIVRPLAMLFPPLDAGKVANLRFIGRFPAALVPPIQLPVLAPSTFVDAIAAELTRIDDGSSAAGVRHRDFDRSERGTLRDIRTAFADD